MSRSKRSRNRGQSPVRHQPQTPGGPQTGMRHAPAADHLASQMLVNQAGQARDGTGPPIIGPMPAFPDGTQGKPRASEINVEYGAPGVVILAGMISSEEYNPDLQWRGYVRMAEKMRRSEPIINQTLDVGTLPMLAASWGVAPASGSPDHLEQASFIDSNLFHDLGRQSFKDILRQAALCRAFGFMLFEKVFAQSWEDGADRPFTKLYDLAPRLPRTIYRWWENATGDFEGVQQWAWIPSDQRYEYLNIPVNKLLRFTYRQEGNNYEGFPLLRTAYAPWWQKQAFIKLMAVGFEREHVGIPVIGLPEGHTDTDIQRAQSIGRNMRSNEMGYIVRPESWQVEWLKSKATSTRGSGILDALHYLDLQMQNNVMAGWLSLGQTGSGSYALSSDQVALYMRNIQSDAHFYEDVFNRDLIPQLIRFNYDDPGMYPSLIAQNVSFYAQDALAKSIAQLIMAGGLRPTVEIEEFLYAQIGIPRPPASFIKSTDPASGEIHPGLKPDETGLTPLPRTPEEEYAIAKYESKVLERVGVNQGQDAAAGAGAKAPQKPATATMGGPTPGRAVGAKARVGTNNMAEAPVNDIYLDERRLGRMNADQRMRYLSMARQAGRPRIDLDRGIRALVPGTTEAHRAAWRENAAADLVAGSRAAFDDFQASIMAAVGEEDARLSAQFGARTGHDYDEGYEAGREEALSESQDVQPALRP